ncbi:MAG TPA: twin transmembrane helix small protein [Gammaproteobacteria bacterium]|nr:twin transmembrane helix small protein [Gammaproteobacteria bacterium]
MFPTLVAILFILILGSLAFSLFAMLKDGPKSKRTVNGLTTRVVLSILLFALLFYGFSTGKLQPHNYQKQSNTNAAAP